MRYCLKYSVAGEAVLSRAARLRRLDETAEIILLERGEYISYANCGLPYHIGDVIRSRDALLVTKAEVMHKRFRVDVRTLNEATAIDCERKTVKVKRLSDGTEYEESYDSLVLAAGSSPIRPDIPGIGSERVMTLWTVPDADRISSMIAKGAGSALTSAAGSSLTSICAPLTARSMPWETSRS